MQTPENKLSADFAQKYPLRILLAEDNPINQQLALHVLGKLGYAAGLAGKWTGGRPTYCKRKKYGLILMDMQMPEIDGMEATRIIRANNQDQPVIVAMTANVMQEIKKNVWPAEWIIT